MPESRISLTFEDDPNTYYRNGEGDWVDQHENPIDELVSEYFETLFEFSPFYSGKTLKN